MALFRSLIVATLLVLASNTALASVVPYEISAVVSFETRNNMTATADQRFFSDGDLVSGVFSYDNSLTGGFPVPGSGTFYPAFINLSGSINGNEFSDMLGAAGVNNDGFDTDIFDPDNELVDFMILVAETGTPGAPAIDGFEILNMGTTFALVNVRLFWIEDGSDFFDDEGLPSILPPGSGIARLALDFADITNPDNRHIVFAEPLAVNPVPVPAAIWFFASALGLLGWKFSGRVQRT